MVFSFKQAAVFEWDRGNIAKNLLKHGVEMTECEEIFNDPDKVALLDLKHSQKEKRYLLLGRTKKGRRLYLVFTLRSDKVRVISVRNLNRKEAYLYEKRPENTEI